VTPAAISRAACFLWTACRVSDTSAGNGKVVVNRLLSLDGFIAGPGHAMDQIFDFAAPDEFPEIAAATGAMLIGRGTYEAARRMPDAGEDSAGGWSGPVFVLTHRPPEPPDPAHRFLTAAGPGPPAEHALISLLALDGLRVSEATRADIEHLGLERGHRTRAITLLGRQGRHHPARAAHRPGDQPGDVRPGQRPPVSGHLASECERFAEPPAQAVACAPIGGTLGEPGGGLVDAGPGS
jgi:hypothetical protein